MNFNLPSQPHLNIFKDKNGSVGAGGDPWTERWAEWATLLIFLLAIIFSVLVGSAFFSYLIAILLGFMCGRYLHLRHWRFPYVLIIIGLLIGFTIGARFSDRTTVVFLFIVGLMLSKWLHEEKKIR